MRCALFGNDLYEGGSICTINSYAYTVVSGCRSTNAYLSTQLEKSGFAGQKERWSQVRNDAKAAGCTEVINHSPPSVFVLFP